MQTKAFIIGIFCTLLLAGCGIRYGFQGGQLNEAIETVSIQYFETRAPLASPTYSQAFTESLRDVFLQQTNLSQVDQYGHLQLEGEITGYDTRPVAVTGDETAALSRLTVSIMVRCENTIEEDKSFEQTFRRFADFNSSENLADVEEALIRHINDQLVQDVFNKVVSDW